MGPPHCRIAVPTSAHISACFLPPGSECLQVAMHCWDSQVEPCCGGSLVRWSLQKWKRSSGAESHLRGQRGPIEAQEQKE